jgi:hypothetical protein
VRARVGQATIVAALLVGAACGSDDARPVATVSPSTTTTVVLRGDAVRYVPRPVPTTRASRSSGAGGRAAEGVHPRAAVRQPTTGSADVWTRLALCESGMRNLRNRPYSGYFQFTLPTWQSLGYGGEAADHEYATQLAGAKRLLARSGPGQWPVCSRKVGL